MATWGEFERKNPELAARGRQIFYHFGVPLGYLATVRRDGGPRIHPFCPIVHDQGLYGLIGPSPKQRDLFRDGRCAIHSFALPDRDDEFYIAGRAAMIEGPELKRAVRGAFLATGATSDGSETLFAFDLEHVMLATYKKRGEPGNWPPVFTKWHAVAG
jgi:hypothetical protein